MTTSPPPRTGLCGRRFGMFPWMPWQRRDIVCFPIRGSARRSVFRGTFPHVGKRDASCHRDSGRRFSAGIARFAHRFPNRACLSFLNFFNALRAIVLRKICTFTPKTEGFCFILS